MSCKKSRELQAAISLGLLFGMGQVASFNKAITHEERADRMKVLAEYIGLHLPIEATQGGVRVGAFTMTVMGEKGWAVTPNGTEPNGATAKTLTDACYQIFTWAAEAEVKAVAERYPLPENQDPFLMNAWAANCQQALTGDGGVFEGEPLKVSIEPSHQTVTAHVGLWMMDEHGEKPLQQAHVWNVYGTDIHPLPMATNNLVGHTVMQAMKLEPVLGMSESSDLFTQGYFSIQYVGSAAGEALGGQPQGWYVIRDGHPYKGPMETPQDAAKWVRREWGSDVESYALIAGMNDQYQEIRAHYAEGVQKINSSDLSEKARRTAYKQLTEQVQYVVSKMTAPYILSEQDNVQEGYHKVGKLVRLQGKDGKQYKVLVFPGTKSKPYMRYTIREVVNDQQWIDVATGTRPMRFDYDKGEENYTEQDVVLESVRILIAGGMIDPAAQRGNPAT